MKRNNILALAIPLLIWSVSSSAMKHSNEEQTLPEKCRKTEEKSLAEIISFEQKAQASSIPSKNSYRRWNYSQRLGISHKPLIDISAEDVERAYQQKLTRFRQAKEGQCLIEYLMAAYYGVKEVIAYRESTYYARLGVWKDVHLLDLDAIYEQKLSCTDDSRKPFLKEAYETLKDPVKKEQYDKDLQAKQNASNSKLLSLH